MVYLDLLSLSSPEELATAIDGGEIYSKRPQAIKAVRDFLKVKIASAFDLTDDMDSWQKVFVFIQPCISRI